MTHTQFEKILEELFSLLRIGKIRADDITIFIFLYLNDNKKEVIFDRNKLSVELNISYKTLNNSLKRLRDLKLILKKKIMAERGSFYYTLSKDVKIDNIKQLGKFFITHMLLYPSIYTTSIKSDTSKDKVYNGVAYSEIENFVKKSRMKFPKKWDVDSKGNFPHRIPMRFWGATCRLIKELSNEELDLYIEWAIEKTKESTLGFSWGLFICRSWILAFEKFREQRKIVEDNLKTTSRWTPELLEKGKAKNKIMLERIKELDKKKEKKRA